jgi:hypothetical protein
METKMTLTFTTRFVRPYFNKVCMANIPGGWEAEVIGGLDDRTRIYTGRCETEAEAIDELRGQCRRVLGTPGKLRKA